MRIQKINIIVYLLLAFMFCPYVSDAQLINIESKRKSNKEGLQGIIGFSLDLKKNTKNIFQGKNAIALQYKKKNNTLLLINDLSFMQIDDEEALVNNGYQHIRYNYTLPKSENIVTLEAFGQHQYNRIKYLQRRIIVGGGPRFKMLGEDTTAYYFYICPLVMYEYEELNPPDELIPTESKIKNLFRGDFYLSMGYEFTNVFSISHVTYFQPDFNNWQDFRISSDTGIRLKITDRLTFSIVYSLDYDSDPPIAVDPANQIPKQFYSILNGINYSF